MLTPRPVLHLPIGVASAAVLALGPVAAGSASEHLLPLGARAPLGNERLSNERTLTRWAHPARRWAVRRAPSRHSARVSRLHARTEDGYAEVYLALRSRRAPGGGVWIQVRIPARPNGQKGWVRRPALGPLRTVTTALLIDKRRSRATLRRSGRRVWRAPIGHGAPGTPTPSGHFYIREKMRNLHGNPLYGPWAFGTSAYSGLSDWPGGGVIGMHGTNQPGLIPGRPSHGCIRVRNPAIVRLARLMPIGTPVRIR
jgi:L,D-transpeptidase catalytic domain